MLAFQKHAYNAERSLFVMPAAESHYITKLLRGAGVDFDYYSWRDILFEKTPIPYEEALARLRPFEERGSWSVAPCAISSGISQEVMLGGVLSLYGPRYESDAGYLLSHGAPSRFDADLGDHPVRDDAPNSVEEPSDAGGAGPACCLIRRAPLRPLRGRPSAPSQGAATLAAELLKGIPAGVLWKNLQLAECQIHEGVPVAIPTEQLLDKVLNKEAPGLTSATFAGYGAMAATFLEVIVSHAVEIAEWYCAENGEETAELHMCMDIQNLHYPGAEVEMYGVARNAETGFVRELRTDAVRLCLRRCEDAPYGFIVSSFEPDLECASAIPTRRDLRPVLWKTDAARRSLAWPDCFQIAHLEYLCDPAACVPVRLGRYLACVQGGEDACSIDDGHFLSADLPCDNPSLSRRVYVVDDAAYLVTVRGAFPDWFRYRPKARIPWRGDSPPSDARASNCRELVELLLLESDGPRPEHFDSPVCLNDPGMFDLFARMYPNHARVVNELVARADEIRVMLRKSSEDEDAAGGSAAEWGRSAFASKDFLPGGPWPWRGAATCRTASENSAPQCSLQSLRLEFDVPDGSSVLAAIARGGAVIRALVEGDMRL